MKFKSWLYSEVRHFHMEEEPIVLLIDGVPRKVTGIDFKWEDFGQASLAAKQFVQEFPHHVAKSPGQVFVNGGYFDGYWIEEMTSGDIYKMRSSDQAKGDVFNKKVLVDRALTDKPPITLQVNPLNKFRKIPKESILEPDGSPASFVPPYNNKDFFHWWDFAEVLDGHTVIKKPARIRT